MPANYVLLERIELNASAASVDFTNIPQSGYTDLKVVLSVRISDSQLNYGVMRINGATTNFTYRSLEGSGSTVGSYNGSVSNYGIPEISSYTANTFSSHEIYIPNYLSSNNKSFSVDAVTENNATASYADFVAGLWANTAAINQLSFYAPTGSFVQYSTFSLYGLAAVGTTPVIAPKASGGNITTDGTYWYHTFLSTGAFVPSISLTCDYFVVAGGGGSGRGGGGAGGLIASTATLSSSTTVTIGGGGSGASGNGTNSSFNSSVAIGGGGGASLGLAQAASGGCGGGGASSGGTSEGGAGSQGGRGGRSLGGGGGGGGGGISADGVTRNSTVAGGDGGNGTNAYSAWASATGTGVSGYYGGGGGGAPNGGGGYGAGGAGGGGSASNGVANTGGGASSDGASGGSGIVIIRYAMA